MTTSTDTRAALASYAALFSYPRAHLAVAARCLRGIAGARAAASLDHFGAWLAEATPEAREEEYTAAFDLSPTCPPYVGQHLVGDGPPRGAFLARLAGVYEANGFVPEGELADHVAVVLQFLADAEDGPDREALLADGLVPALEKMAASFAERESPYRHLVESLGAFASALAGVSKLEGVSA